MKRQRSIGVIVVVGALLVVTYLIFGSSRVTQASCYVCIEYNGQTQCRTGDEIRGITGDGVDVQDAKKAAQKAACAVMASGMNETIACSNTQPTIARCPA